MPPPAVIKQYDEIIENGAERLFKQFESESVHRREMEKIVTKYKGRDLLIGKVLALVFALAVFTVVAVAILNNSPWVAAVLGGGMLGTVIFGFLRIFGDGPRSKPSKQEISKRVD